MSTTEKYKRFDPADYLDDLEDVAGWLAIAVIAEGNPSWSTILDAWPRCDPGTLRARVCAGQLVERSDLRHMIRTFLTRENTRFPAQRTAAVLKFGRGPEADPRE